MSTKGMNEESSKQSFGGKVCEVVLPRLQEHFIIRVDRAMVGRTRVPKEVEQRNTCYTYRRQNKLCKEAPHRIKRNAVMREQVPEEDTLSRSRLLIGPVDIRLSRA